MTGRAHLIVWIAALAGLLLAAPTRAESVKIGFLKTSSGATAVIADVRGYYAAEGLTPEFVTFDAAEPMAVAVTSGAIDFGITGMTAGLYALAGQGALRIISGHLQEYPTFRANAIVASNRAYAAGLTSLKDLAGHSVGVTQVGSSLHYSLALVAEKYGIDLKTIRVVPLQSNSNVATAVTGGQIDAAMALGNFASPAAARGAVKLLAWVGDETPWQFGGVIAATKMTDQHPDTVRRFLAALHHAQRDYHDAFTAADGTRADQPGAPAVLAIIAQFLGQTPVEIAPALAYVDGEGRLDIKDVLHQIAWYKSQGFLKGEVNGNAIIDRRFVIAMPEDKR